MNGGQDRASLSVLGVALGTPLLLDAFSLTRPHDVRNAFQIVGPCRKVMGEKKKQFPLLMT